LQQFEYVRNGDAYWFEHDSELSSSDKNDIFDTKLSTLIARNTAISPGRYQSRLMRLAGYDDGDMHVPSAASVCVVSLVGCLVAVLVCVLSHL